MPVTDAVTTLVDIAPHLTRTDLEAAIRAADKNDFVDPDELRRALEMLGPIPRSQARGETDGLRYHRTPQQQARDIVRDQKHFANELTPLRFTHEQVKYVPRYVEATLRQAARRLAAVA